MIDVSKLEPGVGVWEMTEDGPRRVEYTAPYGTNKIEAKFNALRVYCHVADCFHTKPECYVLAVERAVEYAREVLDTFVRLAQEARRG